MSNKLYIVTLEPIEQRYTKQWHTYWKKEFGKHFDVINIDGPEMGDNIDKGKFLDINKTNIWKAKQVEKIATMFSNGTIKKGDKFIFADGWHFGLTALKYMSQLNNIPVKIYAYWHAGTWDRWDFITQAGLKDWSRHNELGWMKLCDGHFVATNFHKKLIVNQFRNGISNKIHVVGFPMDWEAEIKKQVKKINTTNKENIIVFPHRLDPEKCPEKFDNMKQYIKDAQFIKTLEVTNNKKEYYKLMSKAKVVFSANKQETFGIGTVEGMVLGAIPIVPYGLAYDELYHPLFRYSNILDARDKIKYVLNNYDNENLQKTLKMNQLKIINDSLNSIRKMAEVMKHD